MLNGFVVVVVYDAADVAVDGEVDGEETFK